MGWGTPIAVHVVDHDEIIVNGQLQVVAYNPDTGAQLWNCKGSIYRGDSTPVVGYGMVFLLVRARGSDARDSTRR